MKNLKVAKKLFVSFGTVLLLLTVVVAVAVMGLKAISGELGHFYNKPYQLTVNIDKISSLLQEGAKNMLHACVTTDVEETKKRLDMAADELSDITQAMGYIKSNYGGDPKDITVIENGIQAINTGFTSFQTLCSSNDISGAFEIYEDQILQQLANVNTGIQNLKSFEDQVALSAYESGEKTSASTLALMVLIGGASLLTGIIMSVVITKGMTGPIRELETAANEMEQGNLLVTINYESRDELGSLAEKMRNMSSRISDYMSKITDGLGQLADGDLNVKHQDAFLGDFRPVQDAVRRMVGSLNDTLSQINQSADQVSAGSDQVASGSQALSQGATQQASSVEELAATISEISSQVKRTAQSAENARHKTETAGELMMTCDSQMKDLITAMDEITQKSAEIGKIIKTIEDIAFQTNILALNAAVEAARAGEAGKGFAVVADEVSNLASKSAEASKNTAALIEDSIQAVDKGTRVVHETAQSMSQVTVSAQAVVSSVGEIAKAADQQASSIAQVTQGIDQISSVVQTNSATAEESAAASEELSGQAQMLKNLVGRFKLKAQA